MAGKDWSDLSVRQKTGIVLAGTIQIGLLAAALVDMSRRSLEGIRGSKRLWRAAAFVNFVGPICYFLFGRRR